jgi:hypothetical protein
MEDGEKPGEKAPPPAGPDDVGGIKLEVVYGKDYKEIEAGKERQEIKAHVGGEKGAKQATYYVVPPKPGQKVAIVLTRRSKGDEMLGAVIKVNGRSLYNDQTDDSRECTRWLFSKEKEGQPQVYTGFYTEGEGGKLTAADFEVLTADKAAQTDLGPRGGWIDLDVFTSRDEKAAEDEPPDISTRSLAKGRKPGTLAAAQEALAKANRVKLLDIKFVKRSLEGAMVRGADERPAGTVKKDSLPNPVRIGGISIRYLPESAGGKITD